MVLPSRHARTLQPQGISYLLCAVGAAIALATTTVVVAQQVTGMPETLFLTEQDNGREVSLRSGQELAVSLSENRTTGYRWDLEEADRNLLEVRQGEASYPSAAVGSGGRVQWTARAVAPGTGRLRFKRWRPWEGDKSAVERFELVVRVDP
jgi:inhibitor of cysteine peptidase